MDYESRLSISYYREIAAINQKHHIFLVQHLENHKFFVKKILDVYDINIYRQLKEHPIKGIPQIIELHEEDDKLIIIEEYISGKTMEECLNTDGPVSDAVAANYIVQLCDILLQLHSLTPAIIHRDIKPSNIMITPFGNVVLLDLNAAKYVDSSKNSDTVLLGTQGYAAPEQYGFGSSTVQTDIYAIGILLNALLTGELPSKRMSKGPFSYIIKKCIQLRPEDRYPSVEALKTTILNRGQLEKQEEKKKKPVPPSYRPPGFRNGNVLHMIIAIIGYIMILYFGLSLVIEDVTPLVLWYERIFYTIIFYIIAFFNCNYLDIHRWLPFCKSKSKTVRIIAIIIYDFLILMGMSMLMVSIESLFL